MTESRTDHVAHGAPSFIELCVQDADKARHFYGSLLGWSSNGGSGPGLIDTGGLGVGIHDQDPSALLEVFFSVSDLDSCIERLSELGGKTVSEVHSENAAFGAWVECHDNQGVRFGLRQPPH